MIEPNNAIYQANLERIKSKAFPMPPSRKHLLSMEEVNAILADLALEEVKSPKELQDRLLTCDRGSIVMDFLRTCLKQAHIPYEEKQLGKLTKKIMIDLFHEFFTVEGEEQAAAPEQKKESPAQEPVRPRDRKLREVDLELAQKIYDGARKIPAEEIDPEIDFPNELQIYEGLSINAKDKREMSLKSPEKFYFGAVFLINPDGRVSAVGRMEEVQLDGEQKDTRHSPMLVFDSKNIRYEDFKSQSKFEMVLLPAEAKNILASEDDNYRGELYRISNDIDVFYNSLEITDKPLCIDFGTSNTTAGTFNLGGDGTKSVELVTFQDNTGPMPTFTDIIPTMVYVQSCESEAAPKYLFGYEARKKLMEQDYAPSASFFFEIKRWLNSLDSTETIRDEKGRRATVSRKDIIYAYLRYIINIAEHHFKQSFKNFHFTAPIRQKEIFLDALISLFGANGFHVYDVKNSLDEGMAIIYHTLMQILSKENAPNDANILILDCGGGTTDLSNCRCEYSESIQGNTLRIEAGFENGDSNFGGNNLTYRLLQILKIKIACKLAGGKDKIFKVEGVAPGVETDANVLTMQELINLDENQILGLIEDKDNDNYSLIYSNFEKAYNEAEKYIPTKFAHSTKSRESNDIRRNFNYLWKMAEAIKIEFFKSNLVRVAGEDYKIYAQNMDEYYLYCRDTPDGPLRKVEKPAADIGVTVKEIERVLYPDLYQLLNNILPEDNRTNNYTYCLSGQSCKINIFSTLLKEFIPGRDLRRGVDPKENTSNTDSRELKKYCIRGSIEYMRDKAGGAITSEIYKGQIRHIHNISFHDGQKESPIFICNGDKEPKVEIIHRPKSTTDVSFIVKDAARGAQKNLVEYKINKDKQTPIYEKLEALMPIIENATSLDPAIIEEQIFNKLTDLNAEFKPGVTSLALLALPSKHGYGFRVFQIGIQKQDDGSIYYALPKENPLFPYEDEKLLTYFDGDK